MDFQLGNKIVLVTGATGGIGLSICKAFLGEGSIVVPVFRKDKTKLDRLYTWMKNENIPDANIFPVEMEIENTDNVTAGVTAVINKFSRIDVLVNAAGICPEAHFLAMEEDDWDEVINLNLSAVARMIRIVAKYMWKERSGSIINISSIQGKRFGRGVAAYAASKAAVDRLTEALALEMGKKGIRVNAVCPGLIETGMSEALQYRLSDKLLERTALNRFGQPDEVAKSVLFLASEITSSYITGHKLYVDGGIGI